MVTNYMALTSYIICTPQFKVSHSPGWIYCPKLASATVRADLNILEETGLPINQQIFGNQEKALIRKSTYRKTKQTE